MKKLLPIPLVLLILSGCFGSEKEQKLVLDCNLIEIGPDRFKQEFKKSLKPIVNYLIEEIYIYLL